MVNGIHSHKKPKQRGAAMLEGALTLSAVILMIVGVLDVGQFLFLHQALTERVRGAARTSVIANYDTTSIQNLVVYGTTTPQDAQLPGYYGLRTSNISVVFSGANTNAARLNVTISGLNYPVISPLMAGNFTNLPIKVTVPLETP
jgi:Flp pilus assembly protein TadG